MQTSSIEEWKPIEGYEDRYAVSTHGRIKGLSYLVRYVHGRSGEEMWRRTKEHICATQLINSGYLIVHLNKHGKREALLVHRLVALAFLPTPKSQTVNHINAIKTDNRLENLEWHTYTQNHLHAVDMGLHVLAIPVTDPSTNIFYPSIAQASKKTRKAAKTVRETFIRGRVPCPA